MRLPGGFGSPAYLARLVEQGAVAQLSAFPMSCVDEGTAKLCSDTLVASYSK